LKEGLMRALLTLLLMGVVSPALAQTPSLTSPVTEPPLPSETLATGEDSASRLTVPVMVNGQGPFRFLIDTGSDRSVISKELAEKLALPRLGKATLVSMGGVDQVNTVRIDSLSVSTRRTLKGVQAPALPARHIGADGIVGIDALKGQRIVIDFAAESMLIEPADTREIRDESNQPGTIVVRAKSRLGQLVLVDADANGEEVWVVVDTGGQNSVGNTPLQKLMVKRTPPGGIKAVELVSVVGDRIPAQYMIVGKMRIGGVQMGNAAVAFVDAHPFKRFGLARRPALLLGMDGLRSFRKVSIDFANRRVKFLLPEGTPVGAAP
jgi:predicted aspartyl protease